MDEETRKKDAEDLVQCLFDTQKVIREEALSLVRVGKRLAKAGMAVEQMIRRLAAAEDLFIDPPSLPVDQGPFEWS